MARVHPSLVPSPYSKHSSSEREVFTVWMKSLIMNGNGCTVYDSKGRIVYRVDNYDRKCRGEVYLMDSSGKVLFKILKKKLGFLWRWEGYRLNGSEQEEVRPWFKVKKTCRILSSGDHHHSSCEVLGDAGLLICYELDGLEIKSSYKIVDISGELVAKVNRKQTESGVALGDDVLTLVVEPNMDHCFVMGLVVVYGLMTYSL